MQYVKIHVNGIRTRDLRDTDALFYQFKFDYHMFSIS